MSEKPIVIKDTTSAKRAVARVIARDDKRGGEAAGGLTTRKLSPTQVAVFGPAGTKRATLDRVIAALGDGHVATRMPGRSKGPKPQRARLCIVFDVAHH